MKKCDVNCPKKGFYSVVGKIALIFIILCVLINACYSLSTSNIGNANISGNLTVHKSLSVIQNTSSDWFFGGLNWTNLDLYPASCTSGYYLTQLGDEVTCTVIDVALGNFNVSNNLTVGDSIKLGTERIYSTEDGTTNLSGEFFVEGNVSVFEMIVRNPGSVVIGGFDENGTAFSRISAVEFFRPEDNASRVFVTSSKDFRVLQSRVNGTSFFVNQNSDNDTYASALNIVSNDLGVITGFIKRSSQYPFGNNAGEVINAVGNFDIMNGPTNPNALFPEGVTMSLGFWYDFLAKPDLSYREFINVSRIITLTPLNISMNRLTFFKEDVIISDNLTVTGHANILGNLTGSIFYGEMWNYSSNTTAWTFDIDSSDVYYNLTGIASGELNGFSFTANSQANGGHYLTAHVAGIYEIKGSISFEPSQAAALYGIGVAKNHDITNSRNCYSRDWALISQAHSTVVTCHLRLDVGDTVVIQIENEDNNRDVKIHTVNLNLIRLGA